MPRDSLFAGLFEQTIAIKIVVPKASGREQAMLFESTQHSRHRKREKLSFLVQVWIGGRSWTCSGGSGGRCCGWG